MPRKRKPLNQTLEKIEEIRNVSISCDDELDISELSQFGMAGKKEDGTIEVTKIEKALDFVVSKNPLAIQQEDVEEHRVQAEIVEKVEIEYKEVPLIPLEKIRPNKLHARRINNIEEMEILKESIRANGVLQPIIVRPLEKTTSIEYSYEIIAGYRRYIACYELGMDSIPAVVKQIEPEMVTIVGMVENLVRDNIHPIEETYAILSLIKEITGKGDQDIVSALSRLYREELGQTTPMASNSVDGKIILKIFELLPISLGSFVTHRLKLLSITKEIIEAIINNQIGATTGILIENSIPDQDLKIGLLNEAIAYNYSREKVKERISQIKHEFYEESSQQIKYDLVSLSKKLVSNSIWDDNDRRYINKLEKLVKEMQELFESYENKRKESKKKKIKSNN